MHDIINIKEWENIFIKDVELSDNDARNTAKILNDKGIIEIIEFKEGISIRSNSYVGRIRLGDLQINIYPKLNGVPFYNLLRYAYGLRDLKLLNIAEHTIDSFSFFDLLIYELYLEAEDLICRGIQKSYIMVEEDSSSPRGKININKFCTQGGLIKDTLPCNYFHRYENNILNKTLLAGLKLSLKLVVDNTLKVKLQRLCSNLEEAIDDIALTRGTLKLAKSNINRLTDRYTSVLEIINILYESEGIQLEENSKYINLSGYFFDMNAFFETLVGRLLENCGEGYYVKNQFILHDMFIYTPGFNPCGRKSPTPRPDFALMRNGKVVKLLDAKYRDLWEKSLPREMLYQLAIYAVSGIGDKTSTILYPSMSDEALIQKIDVKDPISDKKMASVILKPLNLIKVSEVIKSEKALTLFVEEILRLNIDI